ncbi:hypothetical protein M885DRAFT_468786 [Pelagophyceae sp. CCMP2097]|nr:hypothetical protein M885DRAFT_468786 [Pelagophyceae sp. CCMP2097]
MARTDDARVPLAELFHALTLSRSWLRPLLTRSDECRFRVAASAPMRPRVLMKEPLSGWTVPILGCAPMVGASECAFRLLVRERGANTTWSPMIEAAGYARSEKYRAEFPFAERDSPCVAQLCGATPGDLAAAAKLLAGMPGVRGVEVNMGCPQRCAKRGGYGAYLLPGPGPKAPRAAFDLVAALRAALPAEVAVLAKTRVLDDRRASVAFAVALADAGADVITVHGRPLRGSWHKGPGGRLADWEVIRLIKIAVAERRAACLVVANGNICDFADVRACLAYTRCDGVMSARALLRDPQLFSLGGRSGPLALARRYVELAETTHAHHHPIRRHLAAILAKPLRRVDANVRKRLMALTNRPVGRGALDAILDDLIDDASDDDGDERRQYDDDDDDEGSEYG